MHPSATLFFDVCVQRDLWPDGVWPLIDAAQAENVSRLFRLAADHGVRQGGVVCIHDTGGPVASEAAPTHGVTLDSAERPESCRPMLPIRIWRSRAAATDELGRDHAIYLDSGCNGAPDDEPARVQVFRHLTAGVRDAVVFGAGVEHGIDRAVDALLRHRIRTHVVLDAIGAADDVLAQTVVARWKRRGVDGVTVDVVGRLLSLSL
jgi:hypothetical protein